MKIHRHFIFSVECHNPYLTLTRAYTNTKIEQIYCMFRHLPISNYIMTDLLVSFFSSFHQYLMYRSNLTIISIQRAVSLCKLNKHTESGTFTQKKNGLQRKYLMP